LEQEFRRKMAVAVAIGAAVIIPIGIVISGLLAGWKGVAGAAVGFGLACLYMAVSIWTLRWILQKPVNVIPTILMVVTWGRLLILAGVLFGLTYVRALSALAMLLSFLALSILYTVVEVIYAYRAFGVLTRPAKDQGE
jgi:hypothetical protein